MNTNNPRWRDAFPVKEAYKQQLVKSLFHAAKNSSDEGELYRAIKECVDGYESARDNAMDHFQALATDAVMTRATPLILIGEDPKQ